MPHLTISHRYGQELNPESYAICKADMLIKGQDITNIVFGNTLSADGLHGKHFDYMLSNPPFGVEWKKIEKEIRKEAEQMGFNGRFGPGLPRVSDGSLLFLHHLKNLGKQAMPLNDGETPKLDPITEAGSGSLQDKEKAYLSEIIEKVNDLFEGDLSDQDKLVYVNNVIKGKLLESETLRQQAVNNTKEQFANSPDLKTELLNAIMGALDAHNSMSTQALNSDTVQRGIKDVLLNNAGLYESLRDKGAS